MDISPLISFFKFFKKEEFSFALGILAGAYFIAKLFEDEILRFIIVLAILLFGVVGYYFKHQVEFQPLKAKSLEKEKKLKISLVNKFEKAKKRQGKMDL